jgi:hypothetical protein
MDWQVKCAAKLLQPQEHGRRTNFLLDFGLTGTRIFEVQLGGRVIAVAVKQSVASLTIQLLTISETGHK